MLELLILMIQPFPNKQMISEDFYLHVTGFEAWLLLLRLLRLLLMMLRLLILKFKM